MQSLAEALSRIQSLIEKKGTHVLKTSDISRSDRELLMHHRWLEEIIRGWYLVVRPDLAQGDSTAWYASFWDFLRYYLEYHYGTDYCLSAESSLDCHLGNLLIPKQVVVMAIRGGGTPLRLPYTTSLLVYADPTRLPEERTSLKGLQIMPLPYALCKISPTFFQNSPQEAEIALRSIQTSSDLLRILVQHEFKSAAGRLIAAYRFLNNHKMADELKQGLENVGISIQEKNPFLLDKPILIGRTFKTPYVARLLTMWEQFRTVVISHFPSPPGMPQNKQKYRDHIVEIYTQDAYNSLSIEGYRVSKELIEKVKKAGWRPDIDLADKQQRDALAARGYYEAFLMVKESVDKILLGESPGRVITADLAQWYQKLFLPSVQAGILSASDLFGYRRHQVYIRSSRHTPPAENYLPELMETFFECLQNEDHAAVRAVLGHFIFVYIHPYMDGNGRLGRFLMNAMLASGGYPWTIVQVAHRNEYLASLEAASAEGDILPLTQFLSNEMNTKIS